MMIPFSICLSANKSIFYKQIGESRKIKLRSLMIRKTKREKMTSILHKRTYFPLNFSVNLLRSKPIRRKEHRGPATIWFSINWVSTKSSLLKQFFPSKQFWVNWKLFSTCCYSLLLTYFVFWSLSLVDTALS